MLVENIYQTTNGLEMFVVDDETYIVMMPDGRRMQTTVDMYHLLDVLKMACTPEQAFKKINTKIDLQGSVEEFKSFLDSVLVPQGFITNTNQSVINEENSLSAEADKSVMDLHLHRDLFSEVSLIPFTTRLRFFYHLPVALVLLSLILFAQVNALFELSTLSNLHLRYNDMFIIFAFVLGSTIFHELGHLTACKTFGASHGALGVGLYFFMPVFYADVSNAWTLPRGQRIIVNLGGIYFQLILTPILLGLFALSQNALFLWFVIITNLLILANLNPVIKFDGYWVVTDTFGLPNLHRRSAELISYSIKQVLWLLNLQKHQPEMTPFLAKLSTRRKIFLSAYIVISGLLWIVIIRLMVPLLYSQIFIVPLVVESLITRFPDINLAIAFEASQYLLMPSLMVLNLLIIVVRVIKNRLQITHTEVN